MASSRYPHPSNGRYVFRHLDGPLEGVRIVVVGAGPLGVATALDLAGQGATVIVLAATPFGVTIGYINAAGLIEPVATADPDATRLFLRGLAFYAWVHPDPLWATRRRQVVFMSDDLDTLRQPWIAALPSARPAPHGRMPRDARDFGVMFDSFVIQPSLAIHAISRELERLEVKIDPQGYEFKSCQETVAHARRLRADAVVVATGIGLADWEDLWDITEVGVHAGLFGGLGATKVIDRRYISLEHVLMCPDDLSYLIPRIDDVVAGGTNDPVEPGDPLIKATKPTEEMIARVNEKIERLWPGASELPGRWLLGARPMRDTVLKTFLSAEHFGLPVVVLGGAGGSGWTFNTGLAEDVSRLLVRELGHGSRLPIFPEDLDAPVFGDEPVYDEPVDKSGSEEDEEEPTPF